MPASLEKRTRSDLVHSRLRSDILAGRLRPAERLKFPELCSRYEASVGVIREALARLTSEGLVVSRNHQGYSVTPLSKVELLDLTEARLEIEATVFRQSVTDGDVEWEGRVISAHHVLARTPMADADDPERMSDEWARVHEDFHHELLNGCKNRRLVGIAETLRRESELYQRWSVSLPDIAQRDVPAEHNALLEAAISRDVPVALSRLQKHIKNTTKSLMSTTLVNVEDFQKGSSENSVD